MEIYEKLSSWSEKHNLSLEDLTNDFLSGKFNVKKCLIIKNSDTTYDDIIFPPVSVRKFKCVVDTMLQVCFK